MNIVQTRHSTNTNIVQHFRYIVRTIDTSRDKDAKYRQRCSIDKDATVLNKQSGQKSNGGTLALGLGEFFKNLHLNLIQRYEILQNEVVRDFVNAVMDIRIL